MDLVCLKRLQLKKGAVPIKIKPINKLIDLGNSNSLLTFIGPFIPSDELFPPESKKIKIDSKNPLTSLYHLVLNNIQLIDVPNNWFHNNDIFPIDIAFHTDEHKFNDILNNANVSQGQSEFIKEIFAAAKFKNPKRRRYNENWMLLCLMFQIRTTKIVVLLFDEISLRESKCVNTRNLTYHSLEDYSDDFNTKTSEKANHALVFMIQGLSEKFHQPIAVFASKGPVKGIDLTKIVLKSILLLENLGIQVLAITSDGASTNRTMWHTLGIYAQSVEVQNSFTNPFDNNRQIFSKSVANGIRFFNIKSYPGFNDCEETLNFTIFMNNLFDALNRKFPAERIKKIAKTWRRVKNNNKVHKLTKYLLDECDFTYVLTNKTNQDCLEKFFGIIRQVASPNDHPTTPTFLQLYRMLSVYSIIKSPKSGNCCIIEDNIPVITIADLKNILNNENDINVRQVKINNLKQKINKIVEKGQRNFEDVFSEHNYSDASSTAFECAVYCMAGSLQIINGTSSHPSADLSLELCFMKHAKSLSPFEDTHEEFFQRNVSLTSPCNLHNTEIVTEILAIQKIR
ncbi:Uncharacterized protein FWK35_00007381, partial [Aphis craccivora]